ncbi:MAG: hypothetical protein HYZ42_15630, partial [Bacteroidetes bacterium]|nr:hypothetical protein [Bacteroidota bacterium]
SLFSTFTVAQTNTKIIIDGNNKDWTFPLKYYDEETRLHYSIANDDSAFYFFIVARDLNTQMRLTRFGFQISIDPKGKKKEKFNLVYKPEMILPQGGGKPEKPSIEKMIMEFKQKLLIVSLNGFIGISDDSYLASNLKSVQFAMDWDTLKALNIEYKIPFSAIGYDTTMKQLSLGIILMPLEMPSGGMQGSGMPSGGMPGGGMGGGSPSGMPPSQQGGMNGGGDLFSEKKVWTKFKPLILK